MNKDSNVSFALTSLLQKPGASPMIWKQEILKRKYLFHIPVVTALDLWPRNLAIDLQW